MFKKLSVLLIIILALVMAACAPAQPPVPAPEKPAPAPAEEQKAAEPAKEEAAAPAKEEAAAPADKAEVGPAKLTIESWRNDDLKIWEDVLIPAFNKHYPDIQVVFAPSAPTEYNAALNAKLEGGTAGDLITCRPFDASLALYDKGYLASLNDLPGMENFGDVAKSAWITDDGSQVFCVPMASVIHGFIYNKEIFAELGLEAPKTEAEFFAVLDAIKADGNYTPLDMGTADQWEAATMGFQNIGPNYWQGETGRLGLIAGTEKFTDPQYVTTWEALAKWAPYLANGYEAQTYPDSQNLFTLGRAAIYPAGSWDIALFNEQAEFEMGAFPPPTPDGADKCYISDHTDIAMGMNANTKSPEAAKLFLEWLATPEFAELYANALPGFFPLSDGEVTLTDPVAQEFINWRGTCESTIRNSYQILSRGEPNLENELWRVSAQVINGKLAPEDAAKEIQDGMDKWYTPAEAAAAPAEEPAAETEAVAATSPVDNPESFLGRAMAGEFEGTKVTVIGTMVDVEEHKFNQAVAPFEKATGIDVVYTGSKEFEVQVNVRVDANDAPDIVDFPQPGFLADMARRGKVVDVSTFMDMDWLKANYNQSWLDMATMAGPDGKPVMAGVWHRASGKSMVFYPKKAFEAAGYEIPQTWDELMALNETIAEDGDTAWCIGIESGNATGWVATDWMENIMLRTTSLENYDKWVTGELPFISPEVKNAVEVMSDIWLNDKYVYGGTNQIVTTFIGDSPVPMFANPPKCWLHMQAGWITDFFGEGLVADEDYDFFYLPPIDEEYGKPVLVAGDAMAMFNDRPEVRALMEYFTTGASVESWVKAGGAISPHQDSSPDWYTNATDKGIAEMILAADSVRFDASDLMPGEVGAGAFWKGMTDYVSGSTDLDTALKEIDAAWPKDK
jgi:raffinose/stachyose/melibiose transport system substrate-binding protein